MTRAFGGRVAVTNVDLCVQDGEIVALVGPNGAGKTTAIRMLVGALRPDAGAVTVDGPIGYLPEHFTAYEGLSVSGYLRFVARMKGVSTDEVHRVLAVVDLSSSSRRPVGRLSKGQRQRVGLAQALLGRPSNFVLDEPSIGLDPRQAAEMRSLVVALRDAGAAVLLSTHLLSEAASIADRIVVMAAGKVVADERPGAEPDLERRFLRLVEEAESGREA